MVLGSFTHHESLAVNSKTFLATQQNFIGLQIHRLHTAKMNHAVRLSECKHCVRNVRRRADLEKQDNDLIFVRLQLRVTVPHLSTSALMRPCDTQICCTSNVTRTTVQRRLRRLWLTCFTPARQCLPHNVRDTFHRVRNDLGLTGEVWAPTWTDSL